MEVNCFQILLIDVTFYLWHAYKVVINVLIKNEKSLLQIVYLSNVIFPTARLNEVADWVCDLEKPSLAVRKMSNIYIWLNLALVFVFVQCPHSPTIYGIILSSRPIRSLLYILTCMKIRYASVAILPWLCRKQRKSIFTHLNMLNGLYCFCFMS